MGAEVIVASDAMHAGGEAKMAAELEVGDAAEVLDGYTSEMGSEQAAFDADRAALEEEVRALVARRWQLERLLDEKSPGQQRTRASLLPGQEEPPPIDLALTALRETEREMGGKLDEQTLREKRAHATRLWCEAQLNDIAKVIDESAASWDHEALKAVLMTPQSVNLITAYAVVTTAIAELKKYRDFAYQTRVLTLSRNVLSQ